MTPSDLSNTWTNSDCLLVRFCNIHLTIISQRMAKLLFYILSLKSILLNLLSHFWGANELTHLPLDKMAVISQTIFSGAFSWKKSLVFWLKFHWGLFPRVQFPHSAFARGQRSPALAERMRAAMGATDECSAGPQTQCSMCIDSN